MLICSRAFSVVIIAHGNEPSAPPWAAAITSSWSIAPAIGASTIGNSVLKRSRSRRSGHMVLLAWMNKGWLTDQALDAAEELRRPANIWSASVAILSTISAAGGMS